jgi:hypothetical protein
VIRRGKIATRLGAVGVAVCLIGGALLGATVMAGASGTSSGCSSCSVTASPSTGLAALALVQVTGTGFTPKATGTAVECNLAPQEPTIAVPNYTGPDGFSNIGSLPVGCSSPNRTPAKVTKSGTITDDVQVATGTVGPPAVGTDSDSTDPNDGQAAADANNYPCPPTQAQVNAGVTCAIVYQDSAGEMAFTPITFTTSSSVAPTTTTTAPPPASCTPTSKSVTTAGATLTVNPATCMVGNDVVHVSASGLHAGALGSILECNNDPSQPTVYVTIASEAIPVSCSNILTHVTTTSASGTVATTNVTIATGTVGPPCATSCTGSEATDSSGGSTTADAAKYPCPPTAAQLALSPPDACVIAFGDQVNGGVGDEVLVPLSFGSGPALPAPAGSTSAGGGSTATATATTTKASSGALAFTGAGPGLTALAVGGIVLLLLGASMVFLGNGPGLVWAMVFSRRRSAPPPVRK